MKEPVSKPGQGQAGQIIIIPKLLTFRHTDLVISGKVRKLYISGRQMKGWLCLMALTVFGGGYS